LLPVSPLVPLVACSPALPLAPFVPVVPLVPPLALSLSGKEAPIKEAFHVVKVPLPLKVIGARVIPPVLGL
jgi:hypothetical protein